MSNTETTSQQAPPNGQAGFAAGAGESSGTVTIQLAPETTATGNPPINPATGRMWTDAEVNTERERIRAEEKSKLYPELEGVRTQLQQLNSEREAETARLAAEAAARETEDAKRREEEMSAKQLIDHRTAEWQGRFAEMETQLAQRDALLDQERRLSELERYKSGVLAQRGDNIHPVLRDFVRGNTPEEIESSVADLEARSLSMLQEMANAQPAPPPRGTTTTAPPNGPMEAAGSTRQVSVEEIRAMSPSEYAQHRTALMNAVSRTGPYGNRG